MKIERFNENTQREYVYYKKYNDNNISEMKGDLDILDKSHIDYYIFNNQLPTVKFSIFTLLPGYFTIDNIPDDYNIFNYDATRKTVEEFIKKTPPITYEDVFTIINANKFNI